MSETKSGMNMNDELKLEADAFSERIDERVKAGHIPDLRRVEKCEYFYKSFWRDPHFVDLFLGTIAKNIVDMVDRYLGPKQSILEVGCGPGYFSLELARAGHDVTGIDISDRAIEIANQMKSENPYLDGFGSLNYLVMSFEDVKQTFDCVLFRGVLHHFDDVENKLDQTLNILKPGGLIICEEPCHDRWQMQDAAQVALIRNLLSLTGFWYESELGENILISKPDLSTYTKEVFEEYVTERDKHEIGGQSPNDNSSNGDEIYLFLKNHFDELEHKSSISFIYRLIGGLRGPDETIHKIADFLTLYDRFCLDHGYMRPNEFYFVGKKPEE